MASNGLAEFKAKLAKLPKQIVDDVNAANKVNAAEWVGLSKAAAPVDPVDGSFLKDSIRMYESDTGGWVVRAGGETTTKPTPGGKGFYDYARAQEFGRQGMPASPYFWPIYRLLKKRMNSRRRRALNKAVKAFNGQ